ncbi:putative LACI-type transcriptional regulator [Klebsiella pneumoniae]|uniref:Putative LACI-type transcriptional regulator n=1 Tax=Klebsiella pneumoniae TaxID=573 RepID=A0A447RYH3_KLEPN|nr:putative LACI-type transcriptional regulator [Klebsiella pneumoniae]
MRRSRWKIIEDLIARKVDAITIVPNDANVLEPVFKKARDAGIVGADQRIARAAERQLGCGDHR